MRGERDIWYLRILLVTHYTLAFAFAPLTQLLIHPSRTAAVAARFQEDEIKRRVVAGIIKKLYTRECN